MSSEVKPLSSPQVLAAEDAEDAFWSHRDEVARTCLASLPPSERRRGHRGSRLLWLDIDAAGWHFHQRKLEKERGGQVYFTFVLEKGEELMAKTKTTSGKQSESAKTLPSSRTVVSSYLVGRPGETTSVTVRIELPTDDPETAGEEA